MRASVRVWAGLALAAMLAGCGGVDTLDWDLRPNSMSTAPAAQGAIDRRPAPDARGVISFPTYQVAVAQRGESLRQMASRLGIDPAELSRQNGLSVEAVMSGGELLVLPGGGAMSAPGAAAGGIAVTPLAPEIGRAHV